VWQGREAQALGLIDEVLTSEEYLHHRMRTHDVIKMAPAPDVRRWFLPPRPGGGGPAGLPIGSSLPPLPLVGGLVGAAVRAVVGGGKGRRRGEVVVAEQEGEGGEEDALVAAGAAVLGRALSSLAGFVGGVGGGGVQPPVFC
jgi:ClpP class serine protease